MIETERLILRDWREEDVEPFLRHTNTPAVMRWLGGVKSGPERYDGIARCMRWQAERGFTFWVVERKADGELLGFCGLKRVNHPGAGPITGDFEVAWRLREDVWGQGYAKEAAIKSIDLAFDRFGASHVVALTVPGNVMSQGLMARLGMKRREDLDFIDPRFEHPGELNPAIVAWIDAGDWPAARAAALA
jgi:RimJ/RimL family protein N-acetyltransferase